MSLGMGFARRRMMAVPGGIAADPILNNNSWEVISAVSTAGEGENFWSVGDRKEIILNGTVGHLSLSNYSVYAFILGFNHNEELEGSGRIHFQLGKTALSGGKDVALCDSKYDSNVTETGYFSMNGSKTNSGGWKSSQMRANICGTSLTSYTGTIIAVIPAELRAVLKSITKYTDNTGNSTAASSVTATTDYFFLLSEFEVTGSALRGNTKESSKQKQYPYYSAGNSIIKNKHNATSTAVFWSFRSPGSSNATSFVGATEEEGRTNRAGANYSAGFAPGFCV